MKPVHQIFHDGKFRLNHSLQAKSVPDTKEIGTGTSFEWPDVYNCIRFENEVLSLPS
jgi:hypothetical protein